MSDTTISYALTVADPQFGVTITVQAHVTEVGPPFASINDVTPVFCITEDEQ